MTCWELQEPFLCPAVTYPVLTAQSGHRCSMGALENHAIWVLDLPGFGLYSCGTLDKWLFLGFFIHKGTTRLPAGMSMTWVIN